MKNITKRAITGAIYILVILAAIFIHPTVTIIIFAAINLLALNEFYKNTALIGVKPQSFVGYIISIIIFSTLFFPSLGLHHTGLAVFCFVIALIGFALTLCLELFRKSENPFTNVGYTFAGLMYITLPFALMTLIHLGEPSQPINLLSLFIFAWCNDTFAYLVGCKWGKHRLFERISPKKSWEGFCGGLIATLVAGVVIWLFYKDASTNQSSVLYWLGLALLMSVFGTLGDLVESMFKRQVGVKDSGNILPGHGGILDRFDVFFIAIPIIYIYFAVFNY
ncbi:MAG: phosphatidate cytidylyltransferase [Bacteroidales bacterium]|jgi:phosphatidate cytidylyltransferase|nr:phosphatidate cytidylyltransferase [Bacteroidales bacterium]